MALVVAIYAPIACFMLWGIRDALRDVVVELRYANALKANKG